MKAMGNLKENTIEELTVVRLSDMGAFLEAGTGNTSDDILLHNNQQTHPVEVGQKVTVFLYHDPHHRLTASMHLPQIPLDGIGYVCVLLTTRFGAFVDVGTERGIFLPFSNMIGRVEKDQYIWVKLYKDKSNRLAVTMHVEDEMRRIALPCLGYKVGDSITGTIYNMTPEGAFLISKDRHILFLHKSELRDDIKMGSEIKGRIVFIRKDGHVNISLRPQKESAMGTDAEALLKKLTENGGELFITDSSDPQEIKDMLGISKSAFKRAVGNLLKKKLIDLGEKSIRLVR